MAAVLTLESISAEVSVPGPSMSLAKFVYNIKPEPVTEPKHAVTVKTHPLSILGAVTSPLILKPTSRRRKF